ncbi:hypothetical protein [Pararhodobacter sp.]|uniref:hypothetical protein n=1 Tax=Pararhodobacter sp. TaxID=2127056 RepID=UPI002AFE751D|nr:hypothetical protein [Pararhodobacter sp.]
MIAGGTLALLAGQSWAQEGALHARVVMSGHSLTDPLLDPLQAMVRAAGGPRDSVFLSTIPGSPLEWRWNNPPGLDLRARISEFDVVVLTERVALSNTAPYHHSADYALRFAQLGWSAGAEVLLFASWVGLDTGPEFAGQGSDPDARLAVARASGPRTRRVGGDPRACKRPSTVRRAADAADPGDIGDGRDP